MNDWAKRLADQIKQQQDREAAGDAKFLEIQRLKKEFGPTLWREVVSEVKSGCDTVNREMKQSIAVVEVTPISELSVRNVGNTARRLLGTFDAEKAQLAWKTINARGQGAGGSYEVGVDKNGKAGLYRQGAEGESLFVAPSSPSEIAQEMLGALLG